VFSIDEMIKPFEFKISKGCACCQLARRILMNWAAALTAGSALTAQASANLAAAAS
jgi:hypothetical protein